MAAGESYLFLGPEIGEKLDAIKVIKNRYIEGFYGGKPPAKPAVEETSFYPVETPSPDIAAFLATGALFSDIRVIYVKSAGMFKKADADNLKAGVEKPAENTLVFMTSDETKIEKTLDLAFAGKNKRVFWELTDSRKPQWVQSFWKEAGFTIRPDAVDLLLEMVENNTEALKQECSRLARFLKSAEGGGGAVTAVTPELVEKHLSHTRSESPFTLFSAVAAGDLPKSLDITRALLGAQESPVAIFAGLLWSYRRFRDYCALSRRGLASNDFELKKAGISNPKAKKDFALALGVFGPDKADALITLTAEFDLLVRTEGNQLKEILMDLYLYRVARLRER